MLELIVIGFVVLLVAGIAVNAMQQYRERIEAERRAEIAKQRAIIDETESVLMTSANMPVSQRLMGILYNRVLNALKMMQEQQSTSDIRQRIADVERTVTNTSTSSAPMNSFQLPESDKLIIQYIHAVKKLRTMLRTEHNKGRVDPQCYIEEDRALENLQIKINVETLMQRGSAAMRNNMMGSARQYFEKAKVALEKQHNADDYSRARIANITQQLTLIQESLREANQQDMKKRKEAERDELDELFAPKKKW